jgi:hypothetical protein
MDNYRQRLGLVLLAGVMVLVLVSTGIVIVASSTSLWADSTASVARYSVAPAAERLCGQGE